MSAMAQLVLVDMEASCAPKGRMVAVHQRLASHKTAWLAFRSMPRPAIPGRRSIFRGAKMRHGPTQRSATPSHPSGVVSAPSKTMPRKLVSAFALSFIGAMALAAVPTLPVLAAPSAQAPNLDPGKMKPIPPAPPKPYRLRIELTLVSTSDSTEGPGNTEDEIYLGLAGIRKKGGVEAVMHHHTVRPGISRDFFEMGKHSADTLDAIVFEGKLGGNDSAAFALLVQEQDNKEAAELAAPFIAIGEALIDAFGGTVAPDEVEYTASGMGALKNDVKKLLDDAKFRGDELMGAVRIQVRGGKLDVKAPSAAKASLLSATTTTAKVKLTGGGSQYILRLVLEDPSAETPITQTYLSREQDGCGQDKLWVDQRTGGSKLLRKGDHGVEVRVKDDVFHWHCGAMDEDDHTNAPDDTNMVEVARSSNGGTITWDCYHERRASAQYEW
jgi:hypothetical protein